jgi:hypothetical protein
MVSCLILLNFTVADKLLGKQYKELVEVSKLLTPEDFWDNYGSQHQQFLPESKRKGEALIFVQQQYNGIIKEIREGSSNFDRTAAKDYV